MADLAAIFHWPPSELEALTLTDVVFWHRIAGEYLGRSAVPPTD
ncbi:GpE family phage tail protein [Elstera cyanobacteriorum]|nr:GpE family phage tail protein [Elstera cyanobacteriorum]